MSFNLMAEVMCAVILEPKKIKSWDLFEIK